MSDSIQGGTNRLFTNRDPRVAAPNTTAGNSPSDQSESTEQFGDASDNLLIPHYVLEAPANADSKFIAQSYEDFLGRPPSGFEVQLAEDRLSGGQSPSQWQYSMFGGPVTVTSSNGKIDFTGQSLASAPGAAGRSGDPFKLANGAANRDTKNAGAIITQAADGTRVEQFANGVTATTTADGTTVVQDANTHTTTIYTANGYTIAATRRSFVGGNKQTQYYWDSTVTDPKGNTDVVWGDPHVIAANGKRFDFQNDAARLANFPGGTVDVTTKVDDANGAVAGVRLQDTLTVNVPGLTLTMQAGGVTAVSVNSGAETVSQDDSTGQTTASVSMGIGYYDPNAKAPDPQSLFENVDTKGNISAYGANQALTSRSNTLSELGVRVANGLSDAWNQVVDSVKGVLDGTGLSGS